MSSLHGKSTISIWKKTTARVLGLCCRSGTQTPTRSGRSYGDGYSLLRQLKNRRLMYQKVSNRRDERGMMLGRTPRIKCSPCWRASFAIYRLVSSAVSALRTKLAINPAPTNPVLTANMGLFEIIGDRHGTPSQAWNTVIRSRSAAARPPCLRFQLVSQ